MDPTTTTTLPQYVNVALDLPMDRLFTYRVPTEMAPRAGVGHRVTVTFRGKPRVGIITETPETAPDVELLEVQEAPDEQPLLGPELLKLAGFIARYYGCSLGEAATAMVPRGVRTKQSTKRLWAQLRDDAVAALDAEGRDPSTPVPKRSEAQQRILRLLRRHPPGYPLTDLCRRGRTSSSPVRTLERQGLIQIEKQRVPEEEPFALGDAGEGRETPHEPTPAQQTAIAAVTGALEAGSFQSLLLLGVTGSGKTEVYLRAIRVCRDQGRQAIVLVPEIALTPQTVMRFQARFPRVAVLHSAMTEAQRAKSWREIRAGQADIVIGPRSAVFAPVPRLGLLILDEEHETTFKQQNTPRYHARDVGLVRARASDAVVVLGSATPSLETYRHALEGRYGLLRLPTRVAGRQLPTVRIVDLKSSEERPQGRGHLSRTLEVRMREALGSGGQVILLQNRRGYATSVACTRCGFVIDCERCDVALTYHRSDRVAMCHLCGHEKRVPSHCPDCALPGLKYRGVGTQTVEEEIISRFPDVRIARMDSDVMSTREAYEEVLSRFGAGEVDVLVGTQMIAKGLDFPGVTLVGIISADTSLALPDFRAAERTFALLAQVAGRAGRGDRDGRVVIQSRLPQHPAILRAAEQDYEAFATKELEEREQFGYPPYARLLRVVVRGPKEAAVLERATKLRDIAVAQATTAATVLGPATPSIARVQGQYRQHLLIKAPTPREIAVIVRALRKAPRPRGRVEEFLDVDPVGVV